MTFQEWFNSAPHRAKYTSDHPAYLAAQEAWEAAHEACAKLVWPTQQVKTWSDEELTAMTGAFNRAQEKHGWYETIMAVGAAALKGRAAAIRARGQE